MCALFSCIVHSLGAAYGDLRVKESEKAGMELQFTPAKSSAQDVVPPYPVAATTVGAPPSASHPLTTHFSLELTCGI